MEKVFNYGSRIAAFPILLFCYSRRMLEGSSVKMAGILAFNLGMIFAADHLGSEVMWRNSESIIK